MPSPWALDLLVAPEDVPFEHTLAKSPHDLPTWNAYYDAASAAGASLHKKIFILERAVRAMPRAAPLWICYLELLETAVAPASFYHHKHEFAMVNRVYQRALMLLGDNHALWERFLRFLTTRQRCQVTYIRRQFNQALLRLSGGRDAIWKLYLEFADAVGGLTSCAVYQKYLIYQGGAQRADGGLVVQVLATYVEHGQLVKAIGLYRSVLDSGRELPLSPLQVVNDYISVLQDLYRVSPSPSLARHLESTIKDAISKYPDQLGPLYVKLAGFLAEQELHAQTRSCFNRAIHSCKTVRDFVLLYDAWTEFEESVLSDLSESIGEAESKIGSEEPPTAANVHGQSAHEKSASPQEEIIPKLATLDFRMHYLDELISSRPFLLNDMKIRKDPHNLDNWFERIDLYKDSLDKVLPTYAQALTQINPLKAHSEASNTLPKLWISYARIYSSKNDWKTANLIFSKSVTSTFKSVDELVDLYIEWTESTLCSPLEDADEKALKVVQNVLFENIAKDELHASVSKNLRLWAFYIDFLQSFIDDDEHQQTNIEKVCEAYTKMIDIKIASPKTILAYANFLQSMSYNERSLTVYESGLRLFKDSYLKFEIWNVYLSKAMSLNLDIERIRDLFDNCLSEKEGIPAHLAKPFVVLYANFEKDHGFLLKFIKVLKRGIMKLSTGFEISVSRELRSKISSDKFDIYMLLFVSTHDTQTKRELFEEAVADDQLTLDQLIRISDEFIDFEVKNSQIARARSLFKFICKLCNPNNHSLPRIGRIWSKWENFEVDHGSEVTFKDMLRFKRSVTEEFEKVSKSNDQLNPMGFIKAETVGGKPETGVKNPEEIDMDM